MAGQQTAARGECIGATATELAHLSEADKLAGFVSQRAMSKRRGTISLDPDELVLSDWGDTGDLHLRRPDIGRVDDRWGELLRTRLAG